VSQRPLALFDFDGTIADSALGIIRCMEHAFKELNHPMPASTDNIIGPPLRTMFEKAGLPAALSDDAIRIYRERYDDLGVLEATVYDGVQEMVDRLADAGVRMAIATSKQEPAARRMLDHFDLSMYFAYIGGATLDGRISAKADVIDYVMSQLQSCTKPSTTMVGDRNHDVLGAATHDIRTVGVLWGYGTEAELRTAGAFELVKHPDEIVPGLFRVA
jgi:phosphoglycolate phosphatase